MIPEHKYTEYYWITLQNFDLEEWENFKREMQNFPKAYTYDGIDDESMSVCFKFGRYIPKLGTEIKQCRQKNLKIKRDILNAIANNTRGKVYFNIRRGILKKL